MLEKELCGDAYSIEVLNDKVVINNDYDGVIILDEKLNLIKKIDIEQDMCIYNDIVVDNERILYNCIENEKIFILNTTTAEVKECDLPKCLVDDVLKEKVSIDNDDIILGTYNGKRYVLDTKQMRLELYNTNDKTVANVDENEFEMPEDCIEHINFAGADMFLFENKLEIVADKKECIMPDNDYYFVRMKVVDKGREKNIYVLESTFDSEKFKVLLFEFSIK